MIVYRLLRAVTGIALRWFYRGVTVQHAERIPDGRTPLLLAVNHPNALVDALVVGWAVPRRVTITAKATLFENPVLGWFLRSVGVVPLRRASDERQRLATGATADGADRSRNTEAFRAILQQLEQGGTVLIFPEGKSHDEPALAPLRTGPARIALQAHHEGRTQSLVILPIGLVFEAKETPRSRVLVDVGQPLDVASWVAANGTGDGPATATALTEEIDRRLRDVTLNYATADEAQQARGLARVFASLLDEPAPIGFDRSLRDEVEVERRLAQARRLLNAEQTDPALRARAEHFLDRFSAFERTLCTERIAIDDVAIPVGTQPGAWFAVRETAVLALAGPVAIWGRLNHWIPFRLARALGARDMSSRDQPAMRTILAGLVLVLLFYALAAIVVDRLAGPVASIAYLLTLPIAADVDLRFTERMQRARERMRAYLRFRRDPHLRHELCTEHEWLSREIEDLSDLLSAVSHR